MKKNNERLHSEKNRLRADFAMKSSAVAQLESQLKDAKTVAIKRCKSILDDAFAIFDVPTGGVFNGKPGRDGSIENERSDRSEYGMDLSGLEPAPVATAPADAPAAPAFRFHSQVPATQPRAQTHPLSRHPQNI